MGTTEVINAGSTAWVLVSAALVMLMTPGLALFYGGLVRSKSVLNMMMMNLMCLGVVTVLWVVFGYSLVFGNDVGGGLLGGLDHIGLRDAATVVGPASDRIPLAAFAMFQLMFAVITAALLAGAIADRTKFWSWTAFIVLWTCLVYFPLAHWVFSFDGYAAERGGWIANQLKALDFAGGTVVEINSGASALALALILGRRRGWPKDPMRPHNMPNVLLGAGRDHPGLRFRGHLGALVIGGLAGVVCALAIKLKYRLGYDDSLDVVALHGVGGLLGTVLIGLFATTEVNSAGADGLFCGGGVGQLGRQSLAAAVAVCYAFGASLLLAWLVRSVLGFRVDREVEYAGIDESEHAESGYDLSLLNSAARGDTGVVTSGAVARGAARTEQEGVER